MFYSLTRLDLHQLLVNGSGLTVNWTPPTNQPLGSLRIKTAAVISAILNTSNAPACMHLGWYKEDSVLRFCMALYYTLKFSALFA